MSFGNDITVRQFVEVGVMGGRLRKNFLYVSSVNYFSNPLKGEGIVCGKTCSVSTPLTSHIHIARYFSEVRKSVPQEVQWKGANTLQIRKIVSRKA